MSRRPYCSQDGQRGESFGFGPMKVPDGTLRHVGSFKGRDGSVLKIMRWPEALDPNDDLDVAWQQEMPLFNIGEVKIMPMKAPSGLIFYQEYTYGGLKK